MAAKQHETLEASRNVASILPYGLDKSILDREDDVILDRISAVEYLLDGETHSMDTEHSGRRYHTIRGSDLQRDGMFLELIIDGRSEAPVMEAFFSDSTGDLSINTLECVSIPLTIVRDFTAEAERFLPPLSEEAVADATRTI